MKRSKLAVLAALTLAGSACGSSTDYGSTGGPPPPPNADVLMVVGASNKGAQAFAPNPFSVALGGGASVAVKWGNADETTHHVVADGASPLFNSGNMAPGSTFSFTFTSAGTFTYHCSIHPNMVGSIQVTP